MVLAPTGTVRPAVALNREEARQSGSFEAPGQRALGRPVRLLGEDGAQPFRDLRRYRG
jgi:hypothetical protein